MAAAVEIISSATFTGTSAGTDIDVTGWTDVTAIIRGTFVATIDLTARTAAAGTSAPARTTEGVDATGLTAPTQRAMAGSQMFLRFACSVYTSGTASCNFVGRRAPGYAPPSVP